MRKGLWAAAAAMALVTACAGTPERDVGTPGPVEYQLGAEDVIEVVVVGGDGMSRTMPVRPDGMISMPLLGDVKAEGRTARELAVELEQKLGTLMHTPRVTVIVREVNAPRVFVLGEVHRPGGYPLRGGMNVVQVLALAGGFAEFADKGGVVLIRHDGTREELDYGDLIDEGQLPYLRPGDTLYVP